MGSDLDLDIARLYQEGLSGPSIADRLNLKVHQVYYRLSKTGTERRSPTINSRKHTVDHDFFREVNSEEQSYWLGFLAADGSLVESRGQKVVKLELSRRDESHLRRFLSDLNSDYPIYRYEVETAFGLAHTSRVAITSPEMFDSLTALGCVQRKGKAMDPPVLDSRWEKHWIRGFVDGDGSIAKATYVPAGFRLKISGLENILRWINQQLPRPGGIYPYSDRNSWALEAHADNVLWLYDDSSVSLGRKRERYEQIRQVSTP